MKKRMVGRALLCATLAAGCASGADATVDGTSELADNEVVQPADAPALEAADLAGAPGDGDAPGEGGFDPAQEAASPAQLVLDSTFDLVSGLPQGVKEVMSSTTMMLTSPATETLLLYCWTGNDLCPLLFSDHGSPSIGSLTATGQAVLDILAAQAETMQQGSGTWPWADPPPWGLQRARFRTTLDLSAGEETWESVSLRLPNATEWTTVPFAPPVSAPAGASIDETGALVVARHGVSLGYGAIAGLAFERWLLPALWGDGSDGLPAVDDWEALLGALHAGRGCLVSSACCAEFASAVAGTTPLPAGTAEEGCQALLKDGASLLEQRIAGLDTEESRLEVGTATPCPLSSASCEWYATFTSVGGAGFSPHATFVVEGVP